MAAAPEVPQLTTAEGVSSARPIDSAGIRDLLSTWVRDLGIALAVAAFFIVFLYQPVKVEGTSMQPSLEDREQILINKFVYRIEPISRGDIVVFRYPRDPQKSFIKRVVGMAGDRVRIIEGRVYVNDKMLEEDYVPAAFEDRLSYSEVVVPPGAFYVLGDHRNLSRDSRDFGPVDSSYIYGKAVFGYWPVEKLGRLK